MVRILAALLFSAGLAWAQNSITYMRVNSNGWTVTVEFERAQTNGIVLLSLSTNTVVTKEGAVTVTNSWTEPNATTPYLIVNSPSFDSTGASNRLTWTNYFTRVLRFPCGLGGQTKTGAYSNDVQANGDNAFMQFALQDYVGLDDIVYGVIPGDLYTATNPLNPPEIFTNYPSAEEWSYEAITNFSTLGYGRVIGNYNWFQFQRVIGTNYRARVSAFHRSGHDGKPVECVKVSVTGRTSGVSRTNTITKPSIDWTTVSNGCPPVVEYVTDLDLTGFTNGELFRSSMSVIRISEERTRYLPRSTKIAPPFQTRQCGEAGRTR
jgi:hypothetical protein